MGEDNTSTDLKHLPVVEPVHVPAGEQAVVGPIERAGGLQYGRVSPDARSRGRCHGESATPFAGTASAGLIVSPRASTNWTTNGCGSSVFSGGFHWS